MNRQPPRRHETPPTRNPYMGPITCLRCDRMFLSWDRRQNRLCPGCHEAIAEEPSEEPTYDVSPRRFGRRDEG
jgi:hypothetical protein